MASPGRRELPKLGCGFAGGSERVKSALGHRVPATLTRFGWKDSIIPPRPPTQIWGIGAVGAEPGESLPASMGLSGNCKKVAEGTPMSFPQWKEVLSAAALPPDTKRGYHREVVDFLVHCRRLHGPATITLARQYLQGKFPTEGGKAQSEPTREALRWFFRAGRDAHAVNPEPSSVTRQPSPPEPTPVASTGATLALPPVAREDLGGADWERDLIVAARQGRKMGSTR